MDWAQVNTGAGNGWRLLLTWIVFIFATAVLGAANVGRRAIRTLRAASAPPAVHGLAATTARAPGAGSAVGTVANRLTATLGAALGAAAASPLVWASALALRTGPTAGTSVASSPSDVVMICAGVGIGLGVALAFSSLTARPVATGVLVTAGWVWLVALASVGLSLADGRTPSVRLAMIDVPQLARLESWKLGPVVMIGVSAWLSIVVSAWGRWRPNRRWEIALSGLAGPALVACAYLTAGPGSGKPPSQVEGYITAMISAGVALVVSTTIAVVSRRQPATHIGAVVHQAAPTGAAAPLPRAAIAASPVPAPRAALPPAAPPAQLPPAPVSAPPVASPPPRALAASATPAAAPKPPQIIYADGVRESARAAQAVAPPTVAAPPPHQVIEGKAKPTPAPKRSDGPAKSKGSRAKKSSQPVAAAPPPPPQPAEPEVSRLTQEEERSLRKRERDHIDWVRNLVHLPNSPELSQPRRRK